MTNKWVLSFIGILALCVLIFVGADYVKFGADNTPLSTTARVIVILLVLFAWVIWRLVSWGLEKRRNNELLDGIEEAEANAAKDPDEERTEAELAQIGGRFRDALGTLRQSRFKAKGNSKALYQLPWYIIIGPPGSGKTTALINSGLDFPLAQQLGKESLGGIGGTRNCDWWFTDEAVLIDTAGRYTTQDSHRVVDNAAWHGFLKLLKKYRRRRPINGALIAISVQDLMVQTAEQRQHHAKTIRGRIDELQEKLGIQFPIYLLFTKVDLVAGFTDFFANLSQAEREQVWGTTFPLEKFDTKRLEEMFNQRYDDILTRLNQRLLWRVHNERNIEARSTMQAFPNRMESLRGTLADFISRTFAENSYHQAPMLRGVYFTSGTQEGTPIDRMMASVSANFGLPRETGRQQSNLGKSFFINRLLKDIIFPESELVGTNRKLERLVTWGRRLGFGALAVAGVATVAVWAGSVTRNELYMGEVTAAVDQYREASAELRPNESNPVQTLAALNPLHTGSQVYDQDAHPWLRGLGLYDGNVDAAAKALYQEKLGAHFLPSLTRSIERQLGRLTADDNQLFETLRVYLMLHRPEHRDPAVIAAWTERNWQQQLPRQADKQAQLQTHLDSLLAQPLPPLAENERVVQRAQRELRRIPASQRLYKQLESANAEPVDLYGRIGGDSQLVFGLDPASELFSTRYLFTKEGFDNVDYGADSPLMNQLAENDWLYGADDGQSFSDADKEQISRDIERAYLNEYSRYWRGFLSNFKIARFNDIQAALDSLQQLSDPTYSPLLTVLEVTTENTRLRPALAAERLGDSTLPANLQDAIPGSLKPTAVDNEFRELHRLVTASQNRPAPIQEILTSINSLYELMGEIAASGNADRAAFNMAKGRYGGGGNDIIKQLHRKAINAPQPVKGWLTDIADNSWRLLLNHTKRHVNRMWEEEVNSVFQSGLARRYPFNRNSSNDASVRDFTGFFGPEGVQKTFVDSYLKTFVDTRKWTTKTLEGAGLYLDAGAIEQLRRAQQIRNVFFSGGPMTLEFTLQQRKLNRDFEKFTFDLGRPARNLDFRHGPAIAKTTKWVTGEHDRARIVVQYLGEDGNSDVKASFNGTWAWLRLFQSANLSSGRDASRISFDLDGGDSEFKLTAKTGAGSFRPDILSRYQHPTSL
ncbi:type VI secretion system membrane subunit TssM [Exilibacterium tricleocarpae]|uniref:type VI secretion system membrane subunit TssM n=1 Tax=Exilibacterium tricleocarpae TaxID=2591008 RepID=UPI0015D1029B|nr:type VI secretion system membrane subunit TssM [Exilibacterium tricleocarpae]